MIDRIDRKYFLKAVSGAYIGKDTTVDIAVQCPVCGDDAHKNKVFTRLHLYHKNGKDFIGCFNGNCPLNKNKTVYSFLRDHYPAILDQYKREKFGTRLKNLAAGNVSGASDVFEKFKEPEKKASITYHDLTSYMKDIIEVPEALEYIRSRGLKYNPNNYGKWYFGVQDLKIGKKIYRIKNSIVIPLWHNSKMYGFYSRSILNKDFSTYMPEQNVGLKIFNWFNVDHNEPVYIYEGIFDSISGSLLNSIALMGAKIPDERLAELKHPVFVLDNDRTGWINSLKYAQMGYLVYIQPHKYPEKDMNELMLEHPEIQVNELIMQNLYSGISAEMRLKEKL